MKPFTSQLFENPIHNQAEIQYWLNYYQNRKENMPLIADKITPTNKAVIFLFLNRDFGSINFQYMYDHITSDYVEIILKNEAKISFYGFKEKFHYFLPFSKTIVGRETIVKELNDAKIVFNIESIKDRQYLVPFYYIQCCYLINCKEDTQARFKETCLAIIKSTYYDIEQLLGVILAFIKQKFNENNCEYVSLLLLNNLEKSGDLKHYTIYALYCKSILSKQVSSSIQDIIFKILFILFHFNCDLVSFKQFIALFPILSPNNIITAYATACEGIEQLKVTLKPTDLNLEIDFLFGMNHHLTKLLALKLSEITKYKLFECMITASTDAHNLIQEKAINFISHFKTLDIAVQDKLPLNLITQSTINYIYELIKQANASIRSRLILDFLFTAIQADIYIDFDILHHICFHELVKQTLNHPELSKSIYALLTSSNKYNLNKQHYFTLILYILDQSYKVNNNAYQLLSLSPPSELNCEKDAVLLFGLCRYHILRNNDISSRFISIKELFNAISTHDAIYVPYYVFLYLQHNLFLDLLGIDNPLRLSSIVESICKYYSKALFSLMQLDMDPSTEVIVNDTDYTAFILNLNSRPVEIINLYFIIHTHLPITNLWTVLVEHMSFLKSEFADCFYQTFLKLVQDIKSPNSNDCRLFLNKIIIHTNIYSLYFQHLSLLCKFTSNVNHLFDFHLMNHPIYFYFTCHLNNQVAQLLPTKTTDYKASLSFLLGFLKSFNSELRVLGLLRCPQLFDNLVLSDILEISDSFISDIPRLLDDPHPQCQLLAMSAIKSFLRYDLTDEQAAGFIKTLCLYGIANKESKQRIASVGIFMTVLKRYSTHDVFLECIIELPVVIQQYAAFEDTSTTFIDNIYSKLNLSFSSFNSLIVIQAITRTDILSYRKYYMSLLIQNCSELSSHQLFQLIQTSKEGDDLSELFAKFITKDLEQTITDYIYRTWPRSTNAYFDGLLLALLKSFGTNKTLIDFLSADYWDSQWTSIIQSIIKQSTMEKQRFIFDKMITIQKVNILVFIGLDNDLFVLKYYQKHYPTDINLLNSILEQIPEKSYGIKNWIDKHSDGVAIEMIDKFNK